MNVFELASHYQQLDALVETNPDNEAVLAAWIDAQGDLKEKIENIGFAIRNREVVLEGLEEAVKNLNQRKASVEGEITRLRELLMAVMTRTNQPKVLGKYLKISLQKNPPSMVLDKDAPIPDEYMKIIPPVPEQRVVDREKLKADLADGVVVAGASLVTRHRVVIK